MRILVFAVALLFIVGMSVLTALDFARHGVTGFSALGQPFDPNLHEALMQQESDEPAGTVVSEMARGYKLNDRLVRPAAVVVAKPRTPAQAAPATDGEGGGQG